MAEEKRRLHTTGDHGVSRDKENIEVHISAPRKVSASKKPSVHIQEPPVSERVGYSIVRVEEKHGPLHRAIPCMPLPLAVICCIFNIFIPGLGEYSIHIYLIYMSGRDIKYRLTLSCSK